MSQTKENIDTTKKHLKSCCPSFKDLTKYCKELCDCAEKYVRPPVQFKTMKENITKAKASLLDEFANELMQENSKNVQLQMRMQEQFSFLKNQLDAVKCENSQLNRRCNELEHELSLRSSHEQFKVTSRNYATLPRVSHTYDARQLDLNSILEENHILKAKLREREAQLENLNREMEQEVKKKTQEASHLRSRYVDIQYTCILFSCNKNNKNIYSKALII